MLFTLDARTGALEQVSLRSLHGRNFDWALGEHVAVIETVLDAEGNPIQNRSIRDRSQANIRAPVSQPGLDELPLVVAKWQMDCSANPFGV